MSGDNAYPYGQCTWFVKEVYPGLPNDMGNGGDWIASARRYQYAISDMPRPGWVVSYRNAGIYDPQYGHVAVVTTVNDDGTFGVKEMHMRGLGIEDERTSTMAGVLGFLMPPGAPGGQYAMPVGTGVVGTPAGAQAGSDPGIGGFLGVLVNGLLVVGGVALVAVGVVLAAMTEGKAVPAALGRAETAQGKTIEAKKQQARADAVQNRRAAREFKKKTYIDGPTVRPRKSREERIAAAVEDARVAQHQRREEQSAEHERALREIPF